MSLSVSDKILRLIAAGALGLALSACGDGGGETEGGDAGVEQESGGEMEIEEE